MNESEPEPSLWETTDKPVLLATVKAFDENGGGLSRAGLPTVDGVEANIGQVWERLRQAGYLTCDFNGSWITNVKSITLLGRQEASGYPRD